jgi:hypothetical protein
VVPSDVYQSWLVVESAIRSVPKIAKARTAGTEPEAATSVSAAPVSVV